MIERSITAQDVKLAILQSDQLEVDRRNPKRLMAKRVYVLSKAPGKTRFRQLLMVIYEVRNGVIDVVTVISTSKVNKYL